MTHEIIKASDYNSVIDVPEKGIMDESADPDKFMSVKNRLSGDRRVRNILIPGDCIHMRTASLAKRIALDFREAGSVDVLIVLTGAIVFASDLCRAMYNAVDNPPDVHFHLVKTSVYDKTIKNTLEEYRSVRMDLEPGDISGRDMLVVEDITDQGFTLTWLLHYLKNERGVNSVRTCSLLNKVLDSPSERVKEIRENLMVDYTGFNIPDVWVAGYGIDAGHDFRHLPFIITVDQSYYS